MLSETRGNYRTTVTVISAAVALIVLIACVNIAGLLLARGEARQTEMAIRGALGAGRGRLLCQLLTESVVLSAIGGLGGLLLATLALHAVVANIPIALPGDAPARMSIFVLGSTMCVVALNAVLFGLVPAIRASKVSSTRLAAESRRQQASTPSLRAGQVLVAIEVALAVVMLAGAGLMLRSFSRLMTVDLGFDPGSYVTMKVEPLDQKSATAALYYPALLQSIRLIPGVVAAGAIDHAPLADGAAVTAVRRPGGAWEQMIQIETALPGYFEAVGLTAHQGRLLTGADMVGPSVVVISEGAARLFFPDGPAVGRQLQLSNVTADVVGVVGDARHFGPADNDRASPCVYRPLGSGANASDGPVRFTVVVRPGAGAHDLSDQLRRAAAGVGPAVIIDGIQYGTDWLDKRVMLPRQRTALLSLLGALGLLLVIIGVFGMTSLAVARRTREIGIRIAFGANPTQVVGRMLRGALVPILVGIGVGTGLAWLTSGVVKGFLFRTSPNDPVTFALVGMTLGVVGALAAWIPARRAARVDPVVALRAD